MMNFQLKPDSEFEDELVDVLPSQSEVLYVAQKNRECAYYYSGINACRNRMLKLAGEPSHESHGFGFLPCKRLVDAHFRCMSDEKYGYAVEDAPQISQNKAEEFYQCAFKELRPMSYCRKYFDGIIRTLYRDPSNKLN